MLRIVERLATDVDKLDQEALKDFLTGMIGKITLNPADLTCCISYEIPATSGEFVASPRDTELTPPIVWESEAVLRPRWRRAC